MSRFIAKDCRLQPCDAVYRPSSGLSSRRLQTQLGSYKPLDTLRIMVQKFPAASLASWNASQRGVFLGILEHTRTQLGASSSYSPRLKVRQEKTPITTGICCCGGQRPAKKFNSNKQEARRQNVDLPPILPKGKKKPYPIPLEKILQASREDKKLAQRGIEKPLKPPKNGLLVPELVSVAYELLDAWKVLIRGVSQLLHVFPVHGCSECSEVHVAQSGHDIQNCLGQNNAKRRSFHTWVKGSINDILVPIESYHMYDPFGPRIKHETRFSYDRIPAVVELCIQAGVELPAYPSRRRTNPIRMLGSKVIDRGGFAEEPKLSHSMDPTSLLADIDTYGALERYPTPTEEEMPHIAQETIDAYEKVKWGVTKLMRKYTVKACGYCSEVHVGPWGHNAKLCGEFKHQWRDGKHGWQDATVDEVFPPNYVWHVRDLKGPPLRSALQRFYGKAPAVVELCMQAGAQVPERYKPLMRLDIVVPESEEAFLVA